MGKMGMNVWTIHECVLSRVLWAGSVTSGPQPSLLHAFCWGPDTSVSGLLFGWPACLRQSANKAVNTAHSRFHGRALPFFTRGPPLGPLISSLLALHRELLGCLTRYGVGWPDVPVWLSWLYNRDPTLGCLGCGSTRWVYLINYFTPVGWWSVLVEACMMNGETNHVPCCATLICRRNFGHPSQDRREDLNIKT